MYDENDLQAEAFDALDQFWFARSVQSAESTIYAFALRLYIAPGIFVQAFLGKQSRVLYFALIKDDRRIFGIDCDDGAWHMHPYGEPGRHEPLPQGLEPKPLLRFLARVEQLIIDHDILADDSAAL